VIATLLHIALLSLRRDRVMQVMVFLLPILFFAIFAAVFNQQARATTARVRVALVDEDGSEASARLVAALKEETGLDVVTRPAKPGEPEPEDAPLLDRPRALGLVKDGDLPVAIVIRAGYGAGTEAGSEIELLADSSDQIAPQIISGLIQKVALPLSPALLAAQQAPGGPPPDMAPTPDAAPPVSAPLRVDIVDVLGASKTDSVVAFYAGGMAVMFLLFNAAGPGGGGALLEEVESGTLERLLSSSAGMGTVLAGKWLFVTLMGVFQTAVMFVFGALVFDLELVEHLPGCTVMTLFTAAAAGAFGLMLAALCRSRQQLNGLSTILILTQSALGGSMFPRFLMSETLQDVGRYTFNAWALDGYIKVLWRDAPVSALGPELAVLAGLTLLFLAAARLLARRWEAI
jgi:ABC-2 type transport system permease protein